MDDKPTLATENLSVRLSIEIKELVDTYEAEPRPEILETIQLKRHVLKELEHETRRSKTFVTNDEWKIVSYF